MINININDYDYYLPADRIAQYPEEQRDGSKLLVYRDGRISQDVFRNIDHFLSGGSLLVFNNTKVIRARLYFLKESGALIEILCMEPLSPPDYIASFASQTSVEWKCIVGNLKKWKSGILSAPFEFKGSKHILKAERICPEGETWRIRFSWSDHTLSFAEVIESAGHIPLPPYIDREADQADTERYQTVYSRVEGSVAAPTAGLHFTRNVIQKIQQKHILMTEVTLHVGAGTFKPVKSDRISEHQMHCEHFSADKDVIEHILEKKGKIIPVGTTSVRTLESLYWLGVKLILNPHSGSEGFSIGQWESYALPSTITLEESFGSILKYMKRDKINTVRASTSIMIVPGYEFKVINALITNFHQPRSTLLLLISAWTGNKWKELYTFALENNFRFLSYGDSSLLFK